MKLAIVIPSGDMVHADFAMCLAAMCLDLRKHDIQVALINAKSSLVQKGRTDGVLNAQRIGADAVLMIDSDMTFPPDTARRLIAHNKAIIGITCSKRVPPYDLVGKAYNGRRWNPTQLNSGLQQAATLGMGVILVDMSVFNNMHGKWFHVELRADEWISEDEFFCSSVTFQGHDIYCDTDLSTEIGHIGMVTHKVQI